MSILKNTNAYHDKTNTLYFLCKNIHAPNILMINKQISINLRRVKSDSESSSLNKQAV